MYKRVSGNYNWDLAILVLSVVILLSPRALLSQGYLKAELRNTNCPVASHEADRWYFGQNAGLDFRPQDPEADLTNFMLNVFTSPAIMADSMGNILFYTDGVKVYNRFDGVMPNGDGLHGSYFSTMPVIIIPKPGGDSIYYIFTTHRARQYLSDTLQPIYGLEFSVVNMNRDGGKGDVTSKNKILLQPEISSKLTAVKRNDREGYWVVAHKFGSDEFCAFSVDENGIDTLFYESSTVGEIHHAPPDGIDDQLGYMKISPDGTKLALAIYGSDIYEIFNFDANFGIVDSAITSLPVFNNAYGIEFSSDSKYLYATTPASPPQPSCLFQFKVSLGNEIFNNYDTIAIDSLGSYFSGLQLGTDGRIYVSRSLNGIDSLSVIQNPKRPGPACNFKTNALDLQEKKCLLGFPNFIQSYFDLPHFDVENVCFADTTIFFLQNNSNIDSISWQFIDLGNPDSSAVMQAQHIFSGPGTYQVQVTEYDTNGIAYGPYSETVIVNELPSVDLADTVYMYPGAPILLDAGEDFVSYEWSTGENTQQIIVSDTGTYYVTVENDRCCFNSDAVVVLFFDVFVPNAFRPGGVNSIFKAKTASPEAVSNFTMYIYNRWGQQIFISNDINQGWDGKINGRDAPGDVYVWLVNYDIDREGRMEKIANKGNVILLR